MWFNAWFNARPHMFDSAALAAAAVEGIASAAAAVAAVAEAAESDIGVAVLVRRAVLGK